MVERLLKVRDVADRLGVSIRQVSKLSSGRQFPRPVRLGWSVGWRERDLADSLRLGCCMDRFKVAAVKTNTARMFFVTGAYAEKVAAIRRRDWAILDSNQ